MAHATTPHGAEFNQLLREWVKHWTGVPIGNLKVNPVSRSVIYERTKGNEVMEASMLKAVVKGVAVELLADQPDTEAWTREWTEKWILSRMQVLGGKRPTLIEGLGGSRVSRVASDSPSALPTTASDALEFSAAGAPNVATHLLASDTRSILDSVGDVQIREIAASHVFIAPQKTPVGYHEKVPIGVYLDLHTAACTPTNREILAAFLATRVEANLGPARRGRTVIATPREGNLLVGSRVAELCGMPFLMVRTKRAPRFGYPIEGRFDDGMEAIIVDDLVMGSLISRTAKLLRRQGLTVDRCFSIFERADADPRTYLDEGQVELDSAWRIDDALLAELAAFGERR